MSRSGRFRSTLIVAAAMLVITCAYSWPLVAHLGGAMPHDRGDPLLVTWILWWSTKAMPLTEHWWNAPAFYPATGVLAFSENLLSLAPITAPILSVTKSPLVAYNVAFLLTYVLSGLSGYFLGFVLTGRHDAASVGAIAFAFAPYRLSHTCHVQLLSSYWMPIAIAALHLYLRSGRTREAALFAVAWTMQSLASGYYLFFLSLIALIWIVWFGPRHLTVRRLTVLALCWAVAVAIMMPLILGYRTIHARYGFKRSPIEIEYYSADVAGLVSASPESLLWGRVHAVDRLESELFPGVTLPILIVAGLAIFVWRRRRGDSAFMFYVGTALLMWLLALGPRPAWFGKPIGIPGPYMLLMPLPGFDEMRVPARLWMLSVLCLSAAAALTIEGLPSGRVRRLVVAACVTGLLLDGWPATFRLAAAPELLPPLQTSSAVARLGLPLAQNETESMYRTIADGLPVFNGYSGYEAPQHPALRDLLDRHDPAILDRLTARGPVQIVVEHELDPRGEWRDYVQEAGARLLDSGTGWSRYELAQQAHQPPPAASGKPLHVVHADASVDPADVNAMFDGDLNSRWHSPEQHGHETVTIDLGTVQQVRWIVLCLGGYSSQYPRSLVVETSADGSSWSTAWSGRPALAVYDAALSDPRSVPIPLPIDREARLIRLRQTADEGTRGWTIVELKVLQ